MRVNCRHANDISQPDAVRCDHPDHAKEPIKNVNFCAGKCKVRVNILMVQVTVNQTKEAHRQSLPTPPPAATAVRPERAAPAPRPATPTPEIAAVPFDQWGRMVKALYRRRKAGEAGAGDTLARVIDNKGGAVYKKLYKVITGESCGCADRQARLNAKYPYSVAPAGDPP